ncbi:Clathrin coat assembly protein AP180 [Characodon lateralis]|uniref:Clathrin coat assembly protein AP180 n=1 Tax=Characodon lateralis TaxID=208331 RepID=A0ABU7D9C9_9TELE|nr:Clathrin coat assembly protein AP180 [Characodon lateralis]
MSGQTLTDRIAAAQYQLTGSDMARAVCKATTHEVMAPKKKHLESLQTYSPRPHATTAIMNSYLMIPSF